jgi:hypothetical protein
VDNVRLEDSAALAEKGLTQPFAGGQIGRGQRLKRVGITNGDEVVPSNLWHNRDVGAEIKMNRQGNKFVESKEVVSLNKWHVQNQNDILLFRSMNE